MTIKIDCTCGHTFTISKRKARKYTFCPRCQTVISIPRRDAKLGSRIRELREEVFGPDGGPLFAAFLNIPQAEWQRIEAGISIPGHLALLLIVYFDVSIDWLIDGTGEMFG